jgi:hypothetical protein
MTGCESQIEEAVGGNGRSVLICCHNFSGDAEINSRIFYKNPLSTDIDSSHGTAEYETAILITVSRPYISDH